LVEFLLHAHYPVGDDLGLLLVKERVDGEQAQGRRRGIRAWPGVPGDEADRDRLASLPVKA